MDDGMTSEASKGMDEGRTEEVESFRDAGFSDESREPNAARGGIMFSAGSEEIADLRGRNAKPSGIGFPEAGMEEGERTKILKV
jgi:hypothetical protein